MSGFEVVYSEVRFTGGPLYWRKTYATGSTRTMKVRDDVQQIKVPGTSRPLRIGTYQRVAPDRFRWVGWESRPTPPHET